MNAFVRVLPIVATCVVTLAFALEPPPNSVEPDKPASQPVAAPGSQPHSSPISAISDAAAHTAASPATQATEVNTAPTPSKPHRIVLEDKTLTNAEVRELFARGYKPIGRGGEVYYCRREPDIGSHFTSMSCKTADQMKQLMQDSKDFLLDRQKPNGCGYGGC